MDLYGFMYLKDHFSAPIIEADDFELNIKRFQE